MFLNFASFICCIFRASRRAGALGLATSPESRGSPRGSVSSPMSPMGGDDQVRFGPLSRLLSAILNLVPLYFLLM
jgi:hypothetical protein